MDKELIRHKQQMNQIAALQRSVVDSMTKLVKYLDGKTTKTEVVNQLKEIGTPDALKVAKAVDLLHETLKTHKNVDLSGITKVMQSVLDEVKQIPKTHPDAPEQLKSVKVSNLEEVDFSGVEKAISNLKAPVVNVDAPVVNVEKPDLAPLQKSFKDVVSAIKDIKYPEIPKIDLKILENNSDQTNKHLTDTNKKLDELIKQPKGGGGGGGTTSFQDADGNAVRAELDGSGNVPVSGSVTTAAPTAVRNGKKTVASAGTAEVIVGSSTTVVGVVIQALESNTGLVYIGNSSVDSTNGMELQAGQATGLAIDNLNKVYVDAAVTGEGVCFIGS